MLCLRGWKCASFEESCAWASIEKGRVACQQGSWCNATSGVRDSALAGAAGQAGDGLDRKLASKCVSAGQWHRNVGFSCLRFRCLCQPHTAAVNFSGVQRC